MRHVRRMRRVYRGRRDALVDALRKRLSGTVDFNVPPGGMALWARVAPDIDVEAWAARGLNYGVAFVSGRFYDFHGQDGQAMRLGFSPLEDTELDEAVRRMAAALPVSRRTARAAAPQARLPAKALPMT